jgi:hypothetical protein
MGIFASPAYYLPDNHFVWQEILGAVLSTESPSEIYQR